MKKAMRTVSETEVKENLHALLDEPDSEPANRLITEGRL